MMSRSVALQWRVTPTAGAMETGAADEICICGCPGGGRRERETLSARRGERMRDATTIIDV